MKKLKMLTAIGFSSIACCAIAPITSCSLKNTWADYRDKKVRFTPRETDIQLDAYGVGTIVYEMDRPLVAEDFEQPFISISNVTLIEQKVEAPTVTLTYYFDKGYIVSGTKFKITLKCPKYRVIEDTQEFTVVI